MPAAEARVAIAMPGRYLTQLCKHFRHRRPVTLAEGQGRIDFADGTCTLAAEEAVLVLRVTAAEAAAMPALQDVVARHLLRFAFRDPPEIRWVPATEPEAAPSSPVAG
ncbi:DUF2218 domain-containing protein [Paracraurococcus lichenis]|uniref:DUF2218 domain-containing protein n=1 Tax=Paracraurococcus lichenis TaxID=3064888 RepID=A0ABT9DTH4_9PROT|nr:DUF2218 domain-containing protein [Paracraurococcus sp. LOR1-02]MDO9707200.1 DUF2218 domain-containing protein [Paracraurococcus sp. LOR1-02]